MVQYVYCGTVDISLHDVASFREVLSSLKIQFDLNDDENEECENDSESGEVEIIEPPPPETIDVEDPSWSDDTKVKIEKNEENSEQLEENYLGESFDVGVEMETEPPKLTAAPHIRRVMTFPNKPSQKITRLTPNPEGKISVRRVVPSLRTQQFMKAEPNICPFCMKKFKTSKHRNEHVKYCFDNPNRIVSTCPLCSKSFCDPYYLRKHLRVVHGKQP